MLRSLMHRLFSPRPRLPIRNKPQHRCRLFMEALEDRAVPDCTGFLSYTMGAWGNPMGNGAAGPYMIVNFASVFPNGVQLGNQTSGAAGSDGSAGQRAALFTTYQAILDFLPHGGGSGALAGDSINGVPLANTDGNLAGQTLALTLNVGFDAANPNFDGTPGNPTYGSLIYTNLADPSDPFNGMTVNQILAEANNYLSGAASQFPASQLGGALTAINEEWDNGLESSTASDEGGLFNIVLECNDDLPCFQTITVSGFKYQDHNGNGVQDSGDQFLANWEFIVWVDSNGDGVRDTATEEHHVFTADGSGGSTLGRFTYSEDIGCDFLNGESSVAYDVQEVLPVDNSWVATQGTGGYQGTFSDGNTTAADLYFGNTHVGSQNGKTLGFWSNKNGQALINATDLACLRALHLRNTNGTDFDPTTNVQVKNFLLGASATNMATMLSAQLIATKLDVNHGFFGSSTSINVDASVLTSWGSNSQGANLADNLNNGYTANGNSGTLVNTYGFSFISALISAADQVLTTNNLVYSGNANRTYMEALKITFDAMNNNLAIFAL